MPQPIWMSVVLLVYAFLAILVLSLATITRLFKIYPQNTHLITNAKQLIKLKKIFGWATLGLLVLSLILPPFVISAEQRTGGEISNSMAFIFFLEWISTIYMAAFWFLAASLDKNLKSSDQNCF
ncbi:MAG: hypothetical protein ACYDDR_14155 [Acidithiobacillus ferrivorans]